ncbi:MAG: 30S ribosomal protein S20 [Lentisphaerae bacterium]|jgi:small subunit ribosomal protein S20|nr:30S ribosomal protein S20 [Lentisphaerota bacterium]
MANTKGAAKRIRTSEKARGRNIRRKRAVKASRKTMVAAVESADQPKSLEAYRAFCSTLDKAAKEGTIHKNAAIRRKARAAAALRKAAAE